MFPHPSGLSLSQRERESMCAVVGHISTYIYMCMYVYACVCMYVNICLFPLLFIRMVYLW